MTREDYNFVGSYDNQRVTTISAERTVNLFEYLDPNGKRPKVLLPTSGLVDSEIVFGTEVGGCRGTFVFDGYIYNVYGNSVFRTTGSSESLSTTKLGEINTEVGYVGIDANQYQVIFVDGQDGWIYDITTGSLAPWQQITDSGFPPNPIDVCYIDGFFLVISGGANNFQLSELNQGMVWSGGIPINFTAVAATDLITLTGVTNANFATGVPVTIATAGVIPPPLVVGDTYYAIRVSSVATNPGTIKLALSYADAVAGTAINITAAGTPPNTIAVTGELQLAQITSHPGDIVACRTLHRRIFLFSQNYTEVWENAGAGTNLPIRRNNSLLMEVGTPAVGSVVTGFDRLFFLAQDADGLAGVMEVRGTEAMPVSNRALDYQLAQYASNPETGVADAQGILIKENGIIFYRLNFTLANHTFVFNVSMSSPEELRWHEEEILNGDRHPAQTHAYFGGTNYYGAYDAPIFYIVDNSVSTNDGEAIRRMRIGRQMTPPGYNRLRIDRFQLDLLQGGADIALNVEIDLLAENGEIIQAEDEENILLDQESISGGGTPVVFLTVSKDGGQTYGNYLIAPMGKLGELTFRTVWRKLGVTPRGQGFTPRIEFFNDIPFVVLGASWDFEILPE